MLFYLSYCLLVLSVALRARRSKVAVVKTKTKKRDGHNEDRTKAMTIDQHDLVLDPMTVCRIVARRSESTAVAVGLTEGLVDQHDRIHTSSITIIR